MTQKKSCSALERTISYIKVDIGQQNLSKNKNFD